MANETSEEREMRLEDERQTGSWKPQGERKKITADKHQPAHKVGSWNPWGERNNTTTDEQQPVHKVGSWNPWGERNNTTADEHNQCEILAVETPEERELRLECCRTRCREQPMQLQLCFNSVAFKAKILCKHGYIAHSNMLNLFRKTSFIQSLMDCCVVVVTSMLQNYTPLPNNMISGSIPSQLIKPWTHPQVKTLGRHLYKHCRL